jgi:hypothetical protein
VKCTGRRRLFGRRRLLRFFAQSFLGLFYNCLMACGPFSLVVLPSKMHILYITVLKIIYMPVNDTCKLNEIYVKRAFPWQKKT